MAKRPDVTVKFDGDATGLRKTITRAEKGLRGFGQRVRGALSGFGAAFGIGGAAAGILGGGAAAQFGQFINDLDRLGKTAQGLNTTVEGLTQLQFAVSQTSTVTEDQLNTSLQRLIKHIGQAQRGVKESQKLFRELGLDWQYLASLQADQAFLEVAGAISAIADPFARASLAQKLFEDNWRTLLPALEAGEQQLRDLTARAAELGGPTTEAALAAAKFNDSIGQLNKSLSGLAVKGGIPIIDFLNEFLENTGAAARPGGALDSLNFQIEALQRHINTLTGERGGITGFLGGLVGGTNLGEDAIEKLNKQLDELIKKRDRLAKQQRPSAAEITNEELEQRRAEPEKQKAETEKKEAEIKKEKVKAEEQELGNLTEREEKLRALDESVNRTTEALMKFQQGLITQAELAEAMGLDVSPALKQRGASGTASNLSGPRTASGGPLPLVDAEGVAQELEYAITQRTYRINIEADVTPTLAATLQTQESVETLADQVGGI